LNSCPAEEPSEGGRDIAGTGEATRGELLETAQLFAEQSYEATTVDDIGARPGRTVGAVYCHYADKEGIAVAVVQDRFAIWSQLAAHYADEAVPPAERLLALSHDIAHALADDPAAR